MARAKDLSLRLEIIKHRELGVSYAELSRQFEINYNTVRSLCLRYEKYGEAGLRTDYSRCGRKTSQDHEKCFRLVRLVSHLHPLWGVPYIVALIRKKFPELPLQSVRQYQRRIRKVKDRTSEPILPQQFAQPPVFIAHDEWQVDAKERIKINDGEQEVCFLNITDSATHSLLKVKVFPLRQDQSSTGRSNSSTDAFML